MREALLLFSVIAVFIAMVLSLLLLSNIYAIFDLSLVGGISGNAPSVHSRVSLT